MTKLDEVKEVLAMFQTSNKLGAEARDALAEARSNTTIETLTEAIRKLDEWTLVRNELKERLDTWQMN